jgi:hypothetical protein
MRRLVPMVAFIVTLAACGLRPELGRTTFGDVRDQIDPDYVYSVEESQFLSDHGFSEHEISRMAHWDSDRAEEFASTYADYLSQLDMDRLLEGLETQIEASDRLVNVGDAVEFRSGPLSIQVEVIDREWIYEE